MASAALPNSLFSASSMWMLSGGHKHIIQRSSHFVPIPTCLSLCLHTRTPHLQSPSHFPSMVMTTQQRPFTTASESIYILISGHFFLHKLGGQVHHWKLCPLRWFSLTTVIQGQAEWGYNATINHFHFTPIYQAVLSLNKAQTFSSSFSWSIVPQVWAEIGVWGNHDEWVWAISSCTCLCPLVLFMLGSRCTISSSVELLLILTNFMTWES